MRVAAPGAPTSPCRCHRPPPLHHGHSPAGRAPLSWHRNPGNKAVNVYTRFVIKMQRLSSSTGVNPCFPLDLLRAHTPLLRAQTPGPDAPATPARPARAPGHGRASLAPLDGPAGARAHPCLCQHGGGSWGHLPALPLEMEPGPCCPAARPHGTAAARGQVQTLRGAPSPRVPPAPGCSQLQPCPASSTSEAPGGTETPPAGTGRGTDARGPLHAAEVTALDPAQQAGSMEGTWRHGTAQRGTAQPCAG